jgi:hypothetical protein
MNQRIKRTQKSEAGQCLCQGLGPLLSDLVKRIGPPEEARRHFDSARLEFLKGLRALLDARIEHFSKSKPKGEKISVE